MNATISDLIRDYLNAAQNSIQIMRHHFGVEHLLRAVGDGLFASQGEIHNETSLKFSFHGYGCAVTTNNYEVDFDFDANGNCTTFDAWRLMLFAQSQPGHYGVLEDRDRTEHELQDLEKKGVVAKAGNHPNSSFYQLAS